MGTQYWAIWMLCIGVSFGLLEGYAFKHPERQWTLSRTISFVGARWPLSIFLWGFLSGGLAAHFFWPWATNPLVGG